MASTECFVQVPCAVISTAANTTNPVPVLNLAGTAAVASIPGSTVFSSARPFLVRLGGTYTTGATSTTLKPQIFVGSSTVTTSNVNFLTNITAVSTNVASSLSSHFIVEAKCVFDSVSSLIDGNASAQIFNVFAGGITTTQVSGVTLGNAGTTGLNFVPFLTFSAASTSNSATITEFSISQI